MVFVGDPLQWTSYEQPTLRSSDGSEILAGTPLSMFAAPEQLGWLQHRTRGQYIPMMCSYFTGVEIICTCACTCFFPDRKFSPSQPNGSAARLGRCAMVWALQPGPSIMLCPAPRQITPPPPRHHIIVLDHIFRQSNPGFIACLREVRYGELGEEAQRKVRLP